MYVKHMKILDTEQVLSKRIQTLKAILGFSGGSAIMNQPANAGDVGLIRWEDPLEKEMATHSSILVWKIPWIEEPGSLQSMGLLSQIQLSYWA